MANQGATSVDYDRAESRPRSKNSNRREKFVPCYCGSCGGEYWLTVSNARRAEKENRVCRRCHSSRIGKKGYQTTMQRVGRERLTAAIVKRQLEKPSKAEIAVKGILDDLFAYTNRRYLTQQTFNNWIMDFVVTCRGGGKWEAVIEVNGYWHKQNRAERDERLKKLVGVPVLFIDADLTKTPAGLAKIKDQIDKFIVQHIGYLTVN